jgi:hypothetical protein
MTEIIYARNERDVSLEQTKFARDSSFSDIMSPYPLTVRANGVMTFQTP